MYKYFLILYFLTKVINFANSEGNDKILVLTVATEECDGYERYLTTAKRYGIHVQTLGLGAKWSGGDMLGQGGGQKINLLKNTLEPLKENENMIVLFTDGYDVIFLNNTNYIVEQFKENGARVLFGAESFCWPDKKLIDDYPEVSKEESRFLNSGLFIGYVPEIYGILSTSKVHDNDDDQLFYTKVFLNKELRKKFGIQLDTKSDIFCNLNGAKDLGFIIQNNEWILENKYFKNKPAILHGNGPSKILLNSFSNYLSGSFIGSECITCQENQLKLDENNLPTITLAIFIEKFSLRCNEALRKIVELDYPKDLIHLFIHSNVKEHDSIVIDFVKTNDINYKSIEYYLKSQGHYDERDARMAAIKSAEKTNSDYLFSIDNNVRLSYPNVLKELLILNRSFVAPLLVRAGSRWSNFWGALNENGYYADSNDYTNIVDRKVFGMWNVPFISSCYLLKRQIFNKIKLKDEGDPDMALCSDLRNEGVFMNIVSMKYYGDLIREDETLEDVPVPELYNLLTNRSAWEKRYINPDYWENSKKDYEYEMLCPDVYRFPILTEKFCDDLIETLDKWEAFESHNNYNAPPKEIQMHQLGLKNVWDEFLRAYAKRLAGFVYSNFGDKTSAKSKLSYIVRQTPKDKFVPELYDLSAVYICTFELTQYGKDFEGGGRDFLRYNYIATDIKKGSMVVHPGRITHNYQDLDISKGTRYAIISFIQS